jgi:hypothetical protein
MGQATVGNEAVARLETETAMVAMQRARGCVCHLFGHIRHIPEPQQSIIHYACGFSHSIVFIMNIVAK